MSLQSAVIKFLVAHVEIASTASLGTPLFFMVALWTQKSPKNCHLRTIVLCRAISSQLRHISTIGKNLLSSNISSSCLHNMVNFGLLAAEVGPVVWGTPANFNGFHVLAALLHGSQVVGVSQSLRR